MVDVPDMETNNKNKTTDNTYKEKEQICEVRNYLKYKTISIIKLIQKNCTVFLFRKCMQHLMY